MGDHSLASARANPRHCILERCPAMRHETRLPFAEIAPEDVARLACYAALDKVAGEVRAPDQIRIAGMARCTLEASVDACARKLRRNALGPDVPPTAYGSQARLQCHGSGVDVQPDEMCTVLVRHVTEISTPATRRMPWTAAASRASAMPQVSSWSVSARTPTPFSAALRIRDAGLEPIGRRGMGVEINGEHAKEIILKNERLRISNRLRLEKSAENSASGAGSRGACCRGFGDRTLSDLRPWRGRRVSRVY